MNLADEQIGEVAQNTNAAMERERQIYEAALAAFNGSKESNEAVSVQIAYLREMRTKAVNFFNCVERSISSTEASGVFKSDFWARDFSSTAANVLESIAFFYEKDARESERLGIAKLQPSQNGYYAMQSLIASYNPDQIAPFRKRFRKLRLPVRGFTHPTKMNKRYSSSEKWAMYLIPVFFLLMLLLIGVWKTDYTVEQFFILRAVLALMGGAFAWMAIPGALHLEGKIKNFSISAAGAVGVTVLIYVYTPTVFEKTGAAVSKKAESIPTNSLSNK